MSTRTRSPDHAAEASAALAHLRLTGWSVAEYTIWYVSHRAMMWVIVGERGRARVLAMGSTQAQARQRAFEQAAAVGRLAAPTT
jgi:hypothetical protein